MSKKHQYQLFFSGLTSDNHSFEYQITDDFFDFFPESTIKRGRLHVGVELNKKDQVYILDFQVNGFVCLPCDRCLEEFEQNLNINQRLYVKFGHQTTDVSDVDDTMVLPFEASEIDLRQHLYDYINMALPLRWVHPEDKNGNPTCNPQALELLNKYLETNDSNPQEIDPRWSELQKLIKKN